MWLGDRDALRVVLKFNDEVEALELMEFIDGTVLQRANDIFTNDLDGGLGGRSGRDHRRGWGSSAGV